MAFRRASNTKGFIVNRFTSGAQLVSSAFRGSQLNRGHSQTAVKVAASGERPPIIQKDLDRLSIGHPAEDDQALLREATEGAATQCLGECMRDEHAGCKYGDTDQQ